MLEIRSMTEIKNSFDVLISRLEQLRKESELENISIETSKTEKQREQRLKDKAIKNEQNIQGLWDNNNVSKSCNGRTRGEESKEQKKHLKL